MGFSLVTVALVVAGIVGTVLRVAFSARQATFSRETWRDVVVGALAGPLWPIVLTPLRAIDASLAPASWTPALQCFVVALLSFLIGHLVSQIIVRRARGFMTAPAAETP